MSEAAARLRRADPPGLVLTSWKAFAFAFTFAFAVAFAVGGGKFQEVTESLGAVSPHHTSFAEPPTPTSTTTEPSIRWSQQMEERLICSRAVASHTTVFASGCWGRNRIAMVSVLWFVSRLVRVTSSGRCCAVAPAISRRANSPEPLAWETEPRPTYSKCSGQAGN